MQESYYDKFIKRSCYKAYYGDIVDEISWLLLDDAFLLTMPLQKIAKLATILMVLIVANNQYCFNTMCALPLAHITIV